MNSPVFTSLLPVVLMIAVGFVTARAGVVRSEGARDLSSLAFLVLTPALLFRTMSTVHLEQLDFRPVASYFCGVLLLFFCTLLLNGLSRRSTVLALACTFSNTVMIGIPLVSLAYGESGLVVLLTLVSVHALVLLSVATLVLEFAVAREALQGSARPGEDPGPRQGAWGAHLRMVFGAARNAVLHPVPLPIIAGLLFAQTGLAMPLVLDKPLQWLGTAFAPLALLLVGVSLAAKTQRAEWNTALWLAAAKNFVLPLIVALLGYFLEVRGVALSVMVVTASLPIGANVFLFSQRYRVAEGEVTAGVAVSTLFALLTVSLAMHYYPV